MSTVADQLRLARDAKNLTVQQVAEVTKIRSDHIRALDEGNYEIFSAPVYVRGFVRTYATVLRLDVPKVMAMLDAELSTTKHHEHPPLMTESRGIVDLIMFQLSKLNWRIVFPLLAVIVLLIFTFLIFSFWSTRKTRDPLAGLGPGIYRPVTTNASGELLPLPNPQKR